MSIFKILLLISGFIILLNFVLLLTSLVKDKDFKKHKKDFSFQFFILYLIILIICFGICIFLYFHY